MKTLDELIRERRSIRSYLDKPVEKEKIEQALEAARLAPSASNAQPWRFVVATGEKRKQILNEGLGGLIVPNSWAKTAPVVVAVCSATGIFKHAIGESVQGTQYHLIDLGIAMEHFVLKATELGLGTCYIGWFNAKSIKRALDLPGSWKVDCVITLGYPEKIPENTPRRNLNEISRFAD
jgi:nitroreductase